MELARPLGLLGRSGISKTLVRIPLGIEAADSSRDDLEKALERVERKTGLSGQPRTIVFHEKEGRANRIIKEV